MSALDKPLLGIFLLTFVGVSWAACPEGQKQTYKGCEVVEEKATEAQPAVQQEAKEVDSKILELGGFIAEEIQIEAAAGQGDTTEMTASLDWDNEGDDWRGIGFKVVLPGNNFEVVSGNINLQVGWWDSSEKEPSQFEIRIDSVMLPSFDYEKMRRCGPYPNYEHIRRQLEEKGMLPLAFNKPTRIMSSSCMYKKLSESDQATVAEMINQIETIVEKGTEEGTPDADYWKTIALRIKANSSLVIGEVGSAEMTASLEWDDRGDDWRSIGLNAALPGDDLGVVLGGLIGLGVSWWGDGSESEPNHITIRFWPHTLPSIDYEEMRQCGPFPKLEWIRKEFEEKGTIRLAFDEPSRIMSSSCMYKKLSESDQATVAEMINQIETIVEKGTEEGTPDADYWKTIALRIKANSSLVIGEVGTGTNITVSEFGTDGGHDWLSRYFDVVVSTDGAETAHGGGFTIYVSWTNTSKKEPDRIRLKFDSATLPSIDYHNMRGCNGWDQHLVKEDSTIQLAFWGFTKFEASRCIYNKLSKADQAWVSIFGNQIYNIVEKGTEGAPDTDYWKKIAFRILVNSPFILSSPASGDHYCINAEDGAPVVYLAVEGSCRQSEHKPIARLSAASKVRSLLKDMSLDAISAAVKVLDNLEDIPLDALSAAVKVLDNLEDIPLEISSAEDGNLTQLDQRLGVTWPSLVSESEITVLDKKYTEKERRDPWRQFKWTRTFSIDAADYDGSQQVLFASVGEHRPLGFQGPLATDTLGYLFDEESQALHRPLTGTIEAVPRRIYFGNVDEDPLPEIIIANTAEDGRSQDYLKAPNFFLNTDDGTAVYFSPPEFSHSILVNDFTGDGLDDVFDLVSGERAGKFYTGINLQKKSYKTYDFDNHAAISADLDNDGAPEIINTYRKYISGVRTIDRKVRVFSFNPTTQAARQIQTIPLVDGKGAVEITTTDWLGTKRRKKAIPLEDGLYLVPLATYEACAFDFEHDGDVDVLWSLTWRKWKSGAEKPTETYIELIALENQGGTLVRRSDVFPERVEIGFGCQLIDFNRDGWNDVYFKDNKHARIWEKIYLNNQDGTFSAMPKAWAQQMFGGQYEIEFSAFVEFDQQLTRFAVVAKNKNTPPKLIRQDFRYDGVETQ